MKTQPQLTCFRMRSTQQRLEAVGGLSKVHQPLTTMDTLTEGMAASDVDAEMTALTPDDINEDSADASDEVEHLQNRFTCSSCFWIYYCSFLHNEVFCIGFISVGNQVVDI